MVYQPPQWAAVSKYDASIECICGGMSHGTFRFGNDRSYFLIGNDECELDIPVVHPSVEDTHAVLQFSHTGTCFVMDFDSKNGTKINKKQIPKNEYVKLRSGDQLTFGDSSLLFLFITSEPETPSSPPKKQISIQEPTELQILQKLSGSTGGSSRVVFNADDVSSVYDESKGRLKLQAVRAIAAEKGKEQGAANLINRVQELFCQHDELQQHLNVLESNEKTRGSQGTEKKAMALRRMEDELEHLQNEILSSLGFNFSFLEARKSGFSYLYAHIDAREYDETDEYNDATLGREGGERRGERGERGEESMSFASILGGYDSKRVLMEKLEETKKEIETCEGELRRQRTGEGRGGERRGEERRDWGERLAELDTLKRDLLRALKLYQEGSGKVEIISEAKMPLSVQKILQERQGGKGGERRGEVGAKKVVHNFGAILSAMNMSRQMGQEKAQKEKALKQKEEEGAFDYEPFHAPATAVERREQERGEEREGGRGEERKGEEERAVEGQGEEEREEESVEERVEEERERVEEERESLEERRGELETNSTQQIVFQVSNTYSKPQRNNPYEKDDDEDQQ